MASARIETRRRNIILLVAWTVLSEWILAAAGAVSDTSPGSVAWDQDQDHEAAKVTAAGASGLGRGETGAGWRPRDRRRDRDDSRRRPLALLDDSDSDATAGRRRQPRRRRRLEPQLGGAVVGEEGEQGGKQAEGQEVPQEVQQGRGQSEGQGAGQAGGGAGAGAGAEDGEGADQGPGTDAQMEQYGTSVEETPDLSDEDIERLSGERDYLNGLVDESAEATGEQACNVAFAKTHKTASTTMAMILVRYARRHDKKLASFGGNHVSEIPLAEAVQQIEQSGERVDVMHYHYTVSGSFQGRWAQATSMYEKIMQRDERINYITVVRSPRSHFLSYYYYYVQPEVQLSVMHFFGSKRKDKQFQYQRRRLANPLCSEFGIHNAEELAHFIEAELPDFRLVLLTEEFDEGLMIMRRLLGWELIDMTYSRMMETKAGARRWDGKELKNVPNWDDLPTWVQERVDANTGLDRVLYDAAQKHYSEMKAVAAVEIESDLAEFEELQKVVNSYLHENTTSEAIQWYSGRAQPYKGGEPFHQF